MNGLDEDIKFYQDSIKSMQLMLDKLITRKLESYQTTNEQHTTTPKQPTTQNNVVNMVESMEDDTISLIQRRKKQLANIQKYLEPDRDDSKNPPLMMFNDDDENVVDPDDPDDIIDEIVLS